MTTTEQRERVVAAEVRVKAVEKIGVRASELTFDWLCGEFEDLPNKLAEDMSVKITDSIIWALGEGSAIDDFADAAQQVTDLKAALSTLQQENERLRGALTSTRAILTVPAAEYVPAIADAWAVIDDALAAEAGDVVR